MFIHFPNPLYTWPLLWGSAGKTGLLDLPLSLISPIGTFKNCPAVGLSVVLTVAHVPDIMMNDFTFAFNTAGTIGWPLTIHMELIIGIGFEPKLQTLEEGAVQLPLR